MTQSLENFSLTLLYTATFSHQCAGAFISCRQLYAVRWNSAERVDIAIWEADRKTFWACVSRLTFRRCFVLIYNQHWTAQRPTFCVLGDLVKIPYFEFQLRQRIQLTCEKKSCLLGRTYAWKCNIHVINMCSPSRCTCLFFLFSFDLQFRPPGPSYSNLMCANGLFFFFLNEPNAPKAEVRKNAKVAYPHKP